MLFRLGKVVYEVSRSLFNKLQKSGQIHKNTKEIRNPSQHQKDQARDFTLSINRNWKSLLDRRSKVLDKEGNLIKYPEAEHLTKGYQELHRLGKIKTDQLKVFRKELEKRYGDKFANYSDDQLTELSKDMNKLLYEGPLATETALTSKAGRKALSQKAKKMNGGSRNRKRGGRVGRPKGVGAALRGYGKVMK